MPNFEVLDASNNPIAGTVSYDPQTMVATFTADNPFTTNSLVTVTLSTNIKDIAGNSLAGEYEFDFTTGSSADVQPPTVLGTSPSQHEQNVSTTKVIVVTFSEPMDASTITA